MALDYDRDRRHTATEVLRRIDDDTAARLETCASAGPALTGERLNELDREWDTDRAIEAEASLVALAGLALGILVRPAFLAIPAAVGAAVFAHALSGWYPLLPVFRRLGIRSAREIERERYALKAVRGDFQGMNTDAPR